MNKHNEEYCIRYMQAFDKVLNLLQSKPHIAPQDTKRYEVTGSRCPLCKGLEVMDELGYVLCIYCDDLRCPVCDDPIYIEDGKIVCDLCDVTRAGQDYADSVEEK